ncbi:uncharacterized protein LOC128739869 [Sabethes cyaneus]|uniref:uncharacterized protein LOC128739869 n=1 Tax=Sabethes cyaneus TaxID=53552 RepID=UPI00237DBED5|nr:uncharacterized protein LOC128739869 [Sabethes cyaneus]
MFWARTLSDIVTGRITPATEARGSSRYRRYSPELTAGQLYGAIENISATLGFHPECLPKSVCELAKVPLDLEQEYLVHEIVHFILTDVGEGRSLLFPSLSIMQMSICTSSGGPWFTPKKVYPYRRLGINTGFQANYVLPYRLSDFYKYPTWARAMVDVVKGQFTPTEVVTARAARKRRSNKPLTAGELYRIFDEALQFSGYDQDCIVKSVCELAHSPFHRVEEDLYAEIVQFFLTPSEHKSFDPEERVMQAKYEYAERMGKQGANCDLLYPKCSRSFLSVISDFMESPTNLIK